MNHLPVPVAPAERIIQDNDAIGHGPQALRDAFAAAKEFALADKAASSRRAYLSDFRDFTAWCASVEQSSLPATPATVAAYLAACADRGLAASTIARRLAAISYAHRLANHDSPTGNAIVRSVLKGIRRKLGTKPRKKAPLTVELVARAIRKIPSEHGIGIRDRALLLIGFGGALRRSELVGLNFEDIERHPEGILLHIRHSKSDQEGKGQVVAIPNGSKLKPVEALDAWTKAARITSGPLFRGVAKGGRVLPDRLCDHQVGRIIKKLAARIGLDPTLFAGHSVRSGFATSAGRKNLVGTAKHLRHAKIDTTMGYIQAASAFDGHAGTGLL